MRDVHGTAAQTARRQAQGAYSATSRLALALARGDPATLRLVRAQIAASDSRRAIFLVVVAGLLALLGALGLITALVGRMRRPLDALVQATRDLASGQLERRVDPDGPREMQDLGTAFNAMGQDLAEAQQRIEEQRHRLAVTIESLGDALLVTEPSSNTIATVNPRATELVPELPVGERIDGERSPHEAEDGLVALDVARRERPTLVFLDVDMPGLNGIDACRELRASPETSETTIVMLTAAHGDRVERWAEEAAPTCS